MKAQPIDLGLLISRGFTQVATWHRDSANRVSFLGHFPSSPGLYLFVEGEVIRYVGSASDGLHRRMRNYQRRQNARNSLRPVHTSLADALGGGASIAVFVKVVADSEQCEWNGLPVDILLGVEAAIIKKINPLWNRRGRPPLL
ncbi:MAG: hypothetical protein K2Y40_15110 [Reyranella sp.]|jgi:hypothetical protein|nr:hypothetical protein [Reyranella sp.]